MKTERKDWSKPIEVSDADIAFPAHVTHLMPSYEELRKENIDKKWERLFCDWFYMGLSELNLELKDGIDKRKALRHIKTIMGSYEPKHEHKTLGVAFLMQQFFKDATWKPLEKVTVAGA